MIRVTAIQRIQSAVVYLLVRVRHHISGRIVFVLQVYVQRAVRVSEPLSTARVEQIAELAAPPGLPLPFTLGAGPIH